jgi:hypothetical protein
VHLAQTIRLGNYDVEDVILGARHQGNNVWAPTSWPVHVYVCTVPSNLRDRTDFSKDEVTISNWGLLHQTLERAQKDLY